MLKFPDAVKLAHAPGMGAKWTSDEELDYLAQQASKCEIVIEVGSWYGRSAKVMAAVCPLVLCVDVWWDNSLEPFLSNLAPELADGRVKMFKGDSGVVAPDVLKYLDGRLADLVWVDDGHLYTDVVRDITSYLPMLKPGHLMIGHDFDPNDAVGKAVIDTLPGYDVAVGKIWRWKKPKD